MRRTGAVIALCLGLGGGGAWAGQEIVLDGGPFRAVLGADAAWRSLTDKGAGRELLGKARGAVFAQAGVGGKSFAAGSATFAGDRLTVGFAGCDTKLTYAVATTPDWIELRLVEVAGPRPGELTMLRLPVSVAEHIGTRMGCAWDDRSAVCLTGLNLQAQCRAQPARGGAELACVTQDAPGSRLEGAAAAIVVAPPAELRGILRRLAERHGLPRNVAPNGTPSKELPIARQSYWFLTFGEKEADRVIELCRQTGFRQVMMNSGSWCRAVGHYTFRSDQYPDGVEGLRRTVAKLHEGGILVGMHCFASKVSKTDLYVTPVPDRRFWVDREARLAADVAPAETTIVTACDLREWPGCPEASQKTWEGGVDKHREAILDDEIVQYESIGPPGQWNTLEGCKRGAWGTRAAGHKAGAACRHYGIDGCINGYIVDQETTLLDETTSRLAGIFDACGFDMVYFDGGEDVDRRRFTYYVTNFQAVAMGKFRRRPIVHMGTIMTHGLWHSFTRSGTVDTYLNTLYGRIISGAAVDQWPTVRQHVDRSVEHMLRVADDMMPGELGWFGIWPKGKNTDGLQLDEIEYLMCRSLAYDAPISLQTSFSQMDRHGLTPGILEIVGAYEGFRAATGPSLGPVAPPTATRGVVPPQILAAMREPGKDFLLYRDVSTKEGEPPEFLAAAAAETVAGGHDVRAMVAPRGDGAVASVWHYLGKDCRLVLPAGARPARAVDIAGKPIPLADYSGRAAVPIGPRRTTVVFERASAENLRQVLATAEVR